MRISIIPEDKKIIVDGNTIDLEDNAPWDFDDGHIHAIQWKDGYGSLEYEDIPGEIPAPNKIFGEEEFSDIVQPYLDYYNSFLSTYEKKSLEFALAQEQAIAQQIEELNLDKLEKEAQLVIIEDLQRQNKELRNEREELYDEQNRLMQKEVFDQQTAKMELERQKLDQEKQINLLETQKAEEYFRNRELELQKNYDKILEEFETQKEAFIEERKQYQELLQMERDKIEKELTTAELQLLEEDLKREKQREIDERLHMEEMEEIDLRKMDLENQRQTFKIQWETNQEVINSMIRDRELFEDDIDKRVKEMDLFEDMTRMRRQSLDEEIVEFMSKKELESLAAREQLQLKNQELLDSQNNSDRQIRTQNILDNLYEDPSQTYSTSEKDYSIDDIISLMDEIDPEKFYTTLTSAEREDNEFPVDKAVQWFSALKDAINKNS